VTNEAQVVALDQIVMDELLQVRNKVDQGVVKKYAEQMVMGIEFPPIRLARIDDALFLTDGWHRVGAARTNGKTEVIATVTPMTRQEATWEAAQANLRHGLPLKRSERRAVFKAYVQAGNHKQGKKYKSYRVIAEELGGIAQHTTIRGWMEKDFKRIFKAMGDSEGPFNAEAGPPKVNLEHEHLRQSLEALDNALALTAALQDPTKRYEVIQRAEKMLKKMKEKPYEAGDF
jgi:hypothetical protein